MKTSNRELRIQRAKELRSDALNRYLADCQDSAKYAKIEMRLYQGTLTILILAAFSNAMGW